MSKNKKLLVAMLLMLCGLAGFFFYKKTLSPPAAQIASEKDSQRKLKRLNEIFAVPIHFTNLETEINLGQIDLLYDPTKLKLLDFTFTGSFAKVFIEKRIDNQNGISRLIGGLPNPGYGRENGLFATAHFQALATGETEIRYAPTSLILANDGKGTNVLKSFPKIELIISDETISGGEIATQQKQFETTMQEYKDADQVVLFK